MKATEELEGVLQRKLRKVGKGFAEGIEGIEDVYFKAIQALEGVLCRELRSEKGY